MLYTKLYKKKYTNKEYAECAAWCNQHNAIIEDKGEYYEVVESPALSAEEVHKANMEARMLELQNYLCSTDWYVIRYVDNGVEIPVEVKVKRQTVRGEIDSLRMQMAEQEETGISS
ncbi:MAG: hypothetical protein IJY48_05695 [Mailhella sp.]|nr:hypothetical protein [Mailhella sp.]